MTRPAAQGADLYEQVRARRFGMCQCTHGQPGACPTDSHPSTGPRCTRRWPCPQTGSSRCAPPVQAAAADRSLPQAQDVLF